MTMSRTMIWRHQEPRPPRRPGSSAPYSWIIAQTKEALPLRSAGGVLVGHHRVFVGALELRDLLGDRAKVHCLELPNLVRVRWGVC